MIRTTPARTIDLALATLVLLFSTSSRATAQPNPTGDVDNIFVGASGEVIRYDRDYRVDAAVHDGVEVVNFYLPTRLVKGHIEGVFIKKLHIDTNTFFDYELIQLVVMPRKFSAFKSLSELRAAKAAELTAARASFSIIDSPEPTEGLTPGSAFEVRLGSGPVLTQLYAETPASRFILTSRLPERFSPYEQSYSTVRNSLADYVGHFTTAPTPREEGAKFNDRWLRIWLPMQAALLLAAFASYSMRLRPTFFWSMSAVFIFTNSGAVASWLLAEAMIRFISPIKYGFAPISIGCLLAAPISASLLSAASRRAMTPTGRALLTLYLIALSVPAWRLSGSVPTDWLPVLATIAFKWGGLLAAPPALAWIFFTAEVEG